MEFIHGDILRQRFVKKNFKDADIVHHLAGITDVQEQKVKQLKKKMKK